MRGVDCGAENSAARQALVVVYGVPRRLHGALRGTGTPGQGVSSRAHLGRQHVWLTESDEAFHAEAVKRGLASKAALIGISRGCLYAHRFAAEHPDKVSVIYGDAGVCDIKSWPGGKGKGKGSAADWASLQKLYGFRDEKSALEWKGGPVDTLEPLANAKIPLIYVVGDSDTAVPAAENALLIEQRYKALGGVVQVIHKPGVDHHPHGLDDPTPVVNFIIEAAKAR
jgi:pimeloyl-ACP methyl ester carboxylesterase